VDKLANST